MAKLLVEAMTRKDAPKRKGPKAPLQKIPQYGCFLRLVGLVKLDTRVLSYHTLLFMLNITLLISCSATSKMQK